MGRGEFWLRMATPTAPGNDFDRAIALRWDADAALFGRANALRQIGDLQGAVRDYAQAAKLAPDRPDYQARWTTPTKPIATRIWRKADLELQKQKQLIASQEAARAPATGPAPKPPAQLSMVGSHFTSTSDNRDVLSLEQERWNKQHGNSDQSREGNEFRAGRRPMAAERKRADRPGRLPVRHRAISGLGARGSGHSPRPSGAIQHGARGA